MANSIVNMSKSNTLIKRKSRVPQVQGVQGRSCSHLPRTLGNEEDGVPSAFPEGKQNGIKNGYLQLAIRLIIKLKLHSYII